MIISRNGGKEPLGGAAEGVANRLFPFGEEGNNGWGMNLRED